MHPARLVLTSLCLLAACSSVDEASPSPFFLWEMRPGQPLEVVDQFLIRQDHRSWEHCATIAGGYRRCVHWALWVGGEIAAIADQTGKVVYIRFSPPAYGSGSDLIFDAELTGMERRWMRVKGVTANNPDGVSEQNPRGTVFFSTPKGRYKVFITFDGRTCTGAPRLCAASVILADLRAGNLAAVDSGAPQLPL
jgi:hypothetical protein